MRLHNFYPSLKLRVSVDDITANLMSKKKEGDEEAERGSGGKVPQNCRLLRMQRKVRVR